MTLDLDSCYRAFASRDRRFEGRFVTAVLTTRIYCRPGCPARLPRRRNLRFYACAAAAESAGFRACLRCRPDCAPGAPAAGGTSVTVGRALRLIQDGALDQAGVDDLATRLGVTARHLRRLFDEHLGASPHRIAQTRRLHFARRLIERTTLPMIEIALSAGFRNVRQFHRTVRATFKRTPLELRRRAAAPASTPPRSPAAANFRERGAIELALRARLPFDGARWLAFLAAREIPGLEAVEDGAYTRGFALTDADGEVEASGAIELCPTRETLEVRVHSAPPRALIQLAARAGRMFDLDADPTPILAWLRRDPVLRRALTRRTDLRVPGAWEPFELAVRAILGQQVSVRAAATLGSRLVRAHGVPLRSPHGSVTHAFPLPSVLARADLAGLGLTTARAGFIRSLAGEVARGALALDRLGPLDAAVERLVALPGIGEWTAQYIAMRGLSEPDAFPAGDLGIAHALAREHGGQRPTPAETIRHAESWRPWRSYAVIALWTADQPQTRRKK